MLDYLEDIRRPTLVVQGSNDAIIPTYSSYVLQQQLPNAQLIIYPDSNHGSFYQYPELFVAHATEFLVVGVSMLMVARSCEALDCESLLRR